MKIYLGADHAGFELKEKLKKYLAELGYQIEDFGNFIYDENDDYPDFIRKVADAVAKDSEKLAPSGTEGSRGIILGGSGQGEAIVANRVNGVRAAVYYGFPRTFPRTTLRDFFKGSPWKRRKNDIIRLSREHNNANILSIGARFISEEEAKKAVKLWLETEFGGEERHVRRINKINLISN